MRRTEHPTAGSVWPGSSGPTKRPWRNVRHFAALGVGASIVVLAVLAFVVSVSPPVSVRAEQSNPPPFDFNDGYYLQNGINPAKLLKRVGTDANPQKNWTFDDSNTDRRLRGVRLLQTTGGFTHDGKLLYYIIDAFVIPDTFTNDAAGQKANEIANRRRAFIFPIRQSDGSYKLDPGLNNRRQDNLFDTSDGYLSDDPLGLWLLAFVELTPFGTTPAGQQILAPFAAANGVGLDGTPVVTTLRDIEDLVAKGVFQIAARPLDGSQGFPWVV